MGGDGGMRKGREKNVRATERMKRLSSGRKMMSARWVERWDPIASARCAVRAVTR